VIALMLAAAAAAAAAEPSALDAFFKGIEKDGPVELSEAVRKELIAHVPAGGREKCEKAGEALESGIAIRDRGDGAVLVAMLHTCRGEAAYAFSHGLPLRVARLFDNEDNKRLVDGLALPLRGAGGKAEEIGLVLGGAQTNELRFFTRRSDQGFTFAPSGVIAEFSFQGACDDQDADHAAGFHSFLRVAEARKLLRLRLDSRCGGGLSSAACEVWHLSSGELEKRGACALPDKLDEAALRASGWR